jgi:hypothetical protein
VSRLGAKTAKSVVFFEREEGREEREKEKNLEPFSLLFVFVGERGKRRGNKSMI